MKRHPRIRKTIKSSGAVAAVVLVMVWIGSWWRFVGWMSTGTLWMRVNPGFVEFGQVRPPNPAWNTPGWTIAPADRAAVDHRWTVHWGSSSFLAWTIAIPLWMPLLATAGVAGLAWRLDTLARRRARFNLCPTCGYDRAGLAGGAACPECGSAGRRPDRS